MWFRLMMLAFVFNGLCSFGLRILADMGLAKEHTLHYLVFWYLGGAVAFLFALVGGRAGISRVDLLVGSGLGVLSGLGQSFIGMALPPGFPVMWSTLLHWRAASSSLWPSALQSSGSASVGPASRAFCWGLFRSAS